MDLTQIETRDIVKVPPYRQGHNRSTTLAICPCPTAHTLSFHAKCSVVFLQKAPSSALGFCWMSSIRTSSLNSCGKLAKRRPKSASEAPVMVASTTYFLSSDSGWVSAHTKPTLSQTLDILSTLISMLQSEGRQSIWSKSQQLLQLQTREPSRSIDLRRSSSSSSFSPTKQSRISLVSGASDDVAVSSVLEYVQSA